jgi:hypothetical protein
MPKKLTFEFVNKYFQEHNCELLETEYINSKTKMKYICKCGNNSDIIFSSFQTGNRCRTCSGSEKLTIEFVKEEFKKQDCELLESIYINNKTKMKYRCSCGNNSEIIFNSFLRGRRCSKCGGSEKLTFDFVKEEFKKQNCTLLENDYINSSTNMKYNCSCGNESYITWDSFKQGIRCQKCAGNEKLTFEFVNKYFQEQNCELLETQYINSQTKMKYICKCGNESSIIWSAFKKGVRCVDCGVEKSIKLSKQFKDYKLPSGNIVKIQGYENLALDYLLKLYNENDIITQRRDVPKIIYTLNKNEHKYYTDIYIKSINKMIEVKSYYTYKKDLIKNILKALASRKLGYNFEFWIYDKNGYLIIV